jgi:hypothetical protein
MSSADPPGFFTPAKWVSLGRPFELPERSEVTQSWLTADGRIRSDLDANRKRDVAQYESGAQRMAMGQLMAIGQAMFMMWMMGGSLSLWTLMLLAQGGLSPVFALMRTEEGGCRRRGYRPHLTAPPP